MTGREQSVPVVEHVPSHCSMSRRLAVELVLVQAVVPVPVFVQR